MAKELRVIIERMVEINDDTFEIIAPLFIRKKLKRKQHSLLHSFFILFCIVPICSLTLGPVFTA